VNIGRWIGLICLILSLYILWQIRQLVLLLFTAVILANALNLLVKQLQKWNDKLIHKLGFKAHLKRGGAISLAIFICLFFLFIFFWLIIPPFVDQSQELTVKINEGIEQINSWLNIWVINLEKELNIDIQEYLPDINDLIKQLPPFLNELIGKGWTFFSNSLIIILNILLLFILTIMLLINPEPYRRGFIRLCPSFYRQRMDEILILCDEGLQGWLTGLFVNMVCITILSFFGLLILGIPLALAQSLLAGGLALIPNIGPALSVIPPMIIALLDDPWKAVAVLILYIIIQQIESNLLTPVVMAKQVDLLPVVTLLAQVFFATFFGFFGLFLALPLTVIGQILLKEIIVKDVLDQWKLTNLNLQESSISIKPIYEIGSEGENWSDMEEIEPENQVSFSNSSSQNDQINEIGSEGENWSDMEEIEPENQVSFADSSKEDNQNKEESSEGENDSNIQDKIKQRNEDNNE